MQYRMTALGRHTPIRPRAFPKMKKFLRPKISLQRPAIVVTTAAARDHAVAIQLNRLDGPIAALMFNRIAAGRTNENKQAS